MQTCTEVQPCEDPGGGEDGSGLNSEGTSGPVGVVSASVRCDIQ
jgi:hypothetical protein